MSVPAALLSEHTNRGAGIQRLLRMLLVAFFAAALLTEPPTEYLWLCWMLVAGYLIWILVSAVLARLVLTLRFFWFALGVDVVVLASLTLITDTTAAVSWTPYLLIDGFFVVPVLAAAQLSPAVCAVVGGSAVVVFLVSGLLIAGAGEEPLSFVLLRVFLLAAVALGAALLSRLQRSRVATIAGLLNERSALVSELVSIEQREQRDLAETLHDGALQYLLAARQDLDDLDEGDTDAQGRIDHALTESARLLRSTMSQLHPGVVEQVGLLSALRDLVEATRARGRFEITLDSRGWDDGDRTSADELLLATARELLTNVVRHARARTVIVQLRRTPTAAQLRVTDDGCGMGEVDIGARLAEGHLGLASRRIRVNAAGGTMRIHPATPHGTVVEVSVPLGRS